MLSTAAYLWQCSCWLGVHGCCSLRPQAWLHTLVQIQDQTAQRWSQERWESSKSLHPLLSAIQKQIFFWWTELVNILNLITDRWSKVLLVNKRAPQSIKEATSGKQSQAPMNYGVMRGCPESKHFGLLADSTWMSVLIHSENYFGIDIPKLDVWMRLPSCVLKEGCRGGLHVLMVVFFGVCISPWERK